MARTAKHDWPMVRLGDVCSINPVTKFGTSTANTEISFVSMDAVSVEGKLDYTEKRTVDAVKSGYSRFNQGDVLLAKITPCFENGKSALAEIETSVGAGSTEFHIFRPFADLDSRYLHYFLRTPALRSVGEANMRGSSGHRRVPSWVFANAKIPLPPLDEQRRIAAVLDEAEDRVRITRSAVHRLDQLLESEFRSRFVAQACSIARLGDLAVWKSGGTPSRSARDYFDGEIPWFTSGELDSAYVSESKECITDLAISESAAKLFGPGTLLVGMYDTAALKSSIATASGTCNQAVAFTSRWLIEPDPLFVYLAIQSIRPKVLMRRRGARQKNLNLSIIREIEIPFPESSIRSSFTTFAERVLELSQKHLRKLHLLEELQKSLSTRAFQGEL